MDIKDLKSAVFDIDMQMQILQAKRNQIMQQIQVEMNKEQKDEAQKPKSKK